MYLSQRWYYIIQTSLILKCVDYPNLDDYNDNKNNDNVMILYFYLGYMPNTPIICFYKRALETVTHYSPEAPMRRRGIRSFC